MRILIIEDDQAIRDTLSSSLIFMGFSVCSVQNGADGVFYLEKCSSEKSPFPSLILLDLNMPVMDGFEFLKVKEQQQWSHLPVIVMSAQSIDVCPTELKPAFLKKPFELQSLFEKLQFMGLTVPGICTEI